MWGPPALALPLLWLMTTSAVAVIGWRAALRGMAGSVYSTPDAT